MAAYVQVNRNATQQDFDIKIFQTQHFKYSMLPRNAVSHLSLLPSNYGPQDDPRLTRMA